MLAYIVPIIFFVVNLTVYNPIRTYETLIIVGVITSPIWYIISDFLKSKALALQLSALLQAPPKKWLLTFICFLSGILFTFGSVYFANGFFDESPEQQCEKSVISKSYQTNKSTRSYFATIPSCVESQFSFLNIDKTENLRISQNEYHKMEPGRAKAIVTYKNGRYGIPWKVSSRVILEPGKPPQLAAYLSRFASEFQDADYLAGVAYFKGTSQPKDDAKAVMHFKLAAERGNAVAQHDLAYMYFNGLGDGVKTAAAFELIKQSAQAGYALAQDYLGVMYGDGKDGAVQDWGQSYYWIKRAALQGYPQAIQDMNYVRAHMTQQQIEEAEKR